jgi:ZIP family zinc transporter
MRNHLRTGTFFAVDRTLLALSASLIAGLSTGLGALPVLFVRRLSPRMISALLGFGGGVMLAAAAFSLLGTAFELYVAENASSLDAVLATGFGFLLGAAFVYGADHLLPHEHFLKGHEGAEGRFVRGAWLFVFAIGLHNLPEGLAVGVGFSGPDTGTGYVISTGIVIQNLPEGLIAAVSLVAVAYRPGVALAIAAATGLVETLGGLLGLLLAGALEPLVPVAMAFAAGAMVYVVGQEVVPESHAGGRSRVATWGIVSGFLLMMALDQLLA